MEARLLVLVLALVRGLRGDVNVMKDVTLGFGEALEKCREESQLTSEMMEQFFHFWSDEFKFERRELGCAIQCMSHHFNLLTSASKVHHENTDKFVKSFPNGEILSTQMVAMLHDCEKQFETEEDHCWRILHIAECFKTSCKQRGLAPTVEMMMAEFIMEAE